MVKKKRIVAGILAASLCALLIKVPALAAVPPVEEPNISVTTDKSAYLGDEKITEIVTIETAKGTAITDVEIRA